MFGINMVDTRFLRSDTEIQRCIHCPISGYNEYNDTIDTLLSFGYNADTHCIQPISGYDGYDVTM